MLGAVHDVIIHANFYEYR